MKNLKHTPGPWVIEYDNDDCQQWLNIGPAKIFFPYNQNELSRKEDEADALLISCAPEMLEALIFEAKISKDNIDGIPIRLKNIIEKATGLTLNEVL